MQSRCKGLILEYVREIETLATEAQNGLSETEDVKEDVNAVLIEALRSFHLLADGDCASNWAIFRASLKIMANSVEPDQSEYRKVIQFAISGLDRLSAHESR